MGGLSTSRCQFHLADHHVSQTISGVAWPIECNPFCVHLHAFLLFKIKYPDTGGMLPPGRNGVFPFADILQWLDLIIVAQALSPQQSSVGSRHREVVFLAEMRPVFVI